jgi:hypothetical protein
VNPVPQNNRIYYAKISSPNYWTADDNGDWEILWPCGAKIEFHEPATLYQLGEAIAEHRDNCKMGCT